MKMKKMKKGKRQTLLLEEVTALKAGTKTINGLSSLANPETNAVDRSPKGSHFRYCSLLCASTLNQNGGVEYPCVVERAFWGFHHHNKCNWPMTNWARLFPARELLPTLSSGFLPAPPKIVLPAPPKIVLYPKITVLILMVERKL